MQTRIKLSVRTLVEFVLRSGDLVSTFSGRSRAVEGTKAHQKVQKAQPDHYRPEVPLSHTIEAEDFVLEIGGRADGIIEQDGITVIDEIKSTDTALDAIHEDDNPLFWAQAKCYAYIYALQQNLGKIQVQLTYYQLEDNTCLRFMQWYSISDLSTFFNDLIERYLDWARLIQQEQANRNQSVKELTFPFESFRAGQRELAVAVYRTVTAGNKLFAQAPTGIGKTLASLFPAVKAIGEGKTEKIFYLTAKTSTREIAEQALAALRQKGLVLKSLTLTAKDKICFNTETDCDPDKCLYARGHYDRIHAALREIYAQPVFTRIVVEDCAKKYQICPFEFSLDLALWADCVICDYNYVFDPRVSLKRFFAEAAGSHCLLIDEAHNLVDRAREMYSAALSKKPISELKQALKQTQPKLAKALAPVQTCLTRWGKTCEQTDAKLLVQNELPAEILSPLYKFVKLADAWLARNESAPFREQLLQVYFAIRAFLRTAEEYESDYLFYVEKKNGGDVTGKLLCVDPSRLLRQVLTSGRPTVFFSATLSPLEYFQAMLAGDETDRSLSVASPFPHANLRVLAADYIATTYKTRDSSCDAVVAAIAAATSARPGNYLVFFPSYRYLQDVAVRYAERINADLICQSAGMTDAEREAFLARFSSQQEGTLVGFAVLGGAFGEGIDLTGERLSGAVIVGIGLPQVCSEREIIRAYYDVQNDRGFEYAYLYPGINKVLQAAGRVIRTDADRGIVLLIDERFSQQRCRRLLPRWWSPIQTVRGPEAVAACSRDFWSGLKAGESTRK